MIKYLLPFSVLMLSACANTTAIESETDSSKQKATAAFAPPANSAAMQTAKPLGLVSGGPVPLNEALFEQGRFADAIEYAENLSSYSLLIWHKGALRLEKYFNGFDAELRPETASMHKSVLGLLIIAAIEDGFIESVDTRIGNYIESWNESTEGDITVRQLLTMSSGLNSLSREGGFDSQAMKFFSGRVDARATILGLRLQTQAGANFSYANTNSQLLALVLESATGKAYKDYLSERLWKPIGADDASVWYYEENGFPRTFSSLLARSRDWLKVGLLIKDGGTYQGQQIIAAELMEAMTSPSANNPNYGWQIWLANVYQNKRYYNDLKLGIGVPVSEPFNADDMVYFDGFGGQRVYISKSQDLVIVRTGDTRMDWDDSALPNMVIESLKNQ